MEGGAGSDLLTVTGSARPESFSASAAAGRVTVMAGAAEVGAGRVERLSLRPLGGADGLTLGDLSGTALTDVALDLGADGQADAVTVSGTAGNDALGAAWSGPAGSVGGLPWAVSASGVEAGDPLVPGRLGLARSERDRLGRGALARGRRRPGAERRRVR